jgi:hypothetical protein
MKNVGMQAIGRRRSMEVGGGVGEREMNDDEKQKADEAKTLTDHAKALKFAAQSGARMGQGKGILDN